MKTQKNNVETVENIETPVLNGLKVLGKVPTDANGKLLTHKPYATTAKAKEMATKILKQKTIETVAKTEAKTKETEAQRKTFLDKQQAERKANKNAKPKVAKPFVDYKAQRLIETANDTLLRVKGYVAKIIPLIGTDGNNIHDHKWNAEMAVKQIPLLMDKFPDNANLNEILQGIYVTAKEAYAELQFAINLANKANLPFVGLFDK